MTDVDTSAEAEFADWFRKNYPGPDTIIHKPDWHSPKIFRVATHALCAERDALKAENERLREALTTIATHTQKCHAHDDDMGHERREFDWEDVSHMQRIARASLTGGSNE